MTSVTAPARSFDPVDALKGEWITARNLPVLLTLVLVAQVLGLGRFLIGSDGVHDSYGRLLGPDFSALWGAGVAALAGDTTASYSLAWFAAHLKDLFGEKAFRLAWSYPPVAYLLFAPLASLPYGVALAGWLGGTLAVFAAFVRKILPHPLTWLAIAAFPGIYANAIQGQTGFFTAALLAGGLLCLDRRPVLAGVLFAMLAIKPQFGVLLPLVLLAEGRWRVIGAAAVTGALLALASVALFGIDTWAAWFAGLAEVRANTLDRGLGSYYIIMSLFGAMREYNAPLWLAYAGQGVLTLGVAGALVWLWRSDADRRLKNAALIAGAMLATPYFIDYDLAMLGAALAFLASYGVEKRLCPWSHTILALAFITPPLARYAGFFLGLPLGFLATLGVFAVALASALNMHRATRA